MRKGFLLDVNFAATCSTMLRYDIKVVGLLVTDVFQNVKTGYEHVQFVITRSFIEE